MSDLFAPTVARVTNPYTREKTDTKDKVNNHNIYMNGGGSDNLALSMQDFLQLMIVQFQNQDMENPASTTDMMNQLMQMSTIQAMATMTDASTMTYSASLVGKKVTVGEFIHGKLVETVGIVTGSATEGGQPVIFVDGVKYSLKQILAVGELPPVENNKPNKPVKPDSSVDPDMGVDPNNPEKPPVDPDMGVDPNPPQKPTEKPDGTKPDGTKPDGKKL